MEGLSGSSPSAAGSSASHSVAQPPRNQAENLAALVGYQTLSELPIHMVVYSPGCAAALCALLRKAESMICATQAYFNHPDVLEEVHLAIARGMEVKLLFDYRQRYSQSACQNQGAIISRLAIQGTTE